MLKHNSSQRKLHHIKTNHIGTQVSVLKHHCRKRMMGNVRKATANCLQTLLLQLKTNRTFYHLQQPFTHTTLRLDI